MAASLLFPARPLTVLLSHISRHRGGLRLRLRGRGRVPPSWGGRVGCPPPSPCTGRRGGWRWWALLLLLWSHPALAHPAQGHIPKLGLPSALRRGGTIHAVLLFGSWRGGQGWDWWGCPPSSCGSSCGRTDQEVVRCHHCAVTLPHVDVAVALGGAARPEVSECLSGRVAHRRLVPRPAILRQAGAPAAGGLDRPVRPRRRDVPRPGPKGPREKLEPKGPRNRRRRGGRGREGKGQERTLPPHQALTP